MILVDENVPSSMIAALREAGFSIELMEHVDAGAVDELVLGYAVERGLIVLTQDTDFGDLVYKNGLPHAGVVLVRLRGMDLAEKSRRVVEVFLDGGAALVGAFTVISNSGIRIRRVSQ